MDRYSVSTGIVGFISFLRGFSNFLGHIIVTKEDEKEVIKEFQVQIRHLEHILSEVHWYKEELLATHPGNQSVDCSEFEAYLWECRIRVEEFSDILKDPTAQRKALLDCSKWPLRLEAREKLADLTNEYKGVLLRQLILQKGHAIHETALGIRETAVDIYTKTVAIHETAVDIQIKSAATQSTIQRDKMINRLDVVNVNIILDKAREKCHPSTGNWFLTGLEFENFKQNRGEHIWLHGMPGAGKTVLSGSIIAALMDHIKNTSTYALAYFFFSYSDEDKQNVYNMLSSTAGQLCRRTRTIPEEVVTALECNMNRLPISVLLAIISSLSQCFSKVYIVLDALDEIKIKERDLLVNTIQTLVRRPSVFNINLIMTSRQENYLINGFVKLPIQDVVLTNAVIDRDIRFYVSETFSKAPTLWRWDPDMCSMTKRIVEALSEGAKGMFRWVDCQVENLKGCLRACDIEHTLCSLPAGLDETYKRILLSIEKRYQVYAARLLSWITFTEQPLCVGVLAEAIVFESEASELNSGWRFGNPGSIPGICKNLINSSPSYSYHCCPSDEKDDDIHHCLSLSHYSVKEYLLSERFKQDDELTVYSSLFAKGHSYLIDVWIKYWQMVALRYRPDFRRDETWSQCRPLLQHCISALMAHVKALDSDPVRKQLEERVAHLTCDNPGLVCRAFKYYLIWCPVSILVFFGLYDGIGIATCVRRGYTVHSVKKTYSGPVTPLNLAMYHLDDREHPPSIAFLSTLFKNGATDTIEAPFGKLSPALMTAVKHCNDQLPNCVDIIHLLLRRGSHVHSPHYPRGSLFLAIRECARNVYDSSKVDMWRRIFDFIPTPASYHDLVFCQTCDGLVHSFVGEVAEYYAAIGDFHSLCNILDRGAAIRKPVRQPNTITTLFKCRLGNCASDCPQYLGHRSCLYVSPNIFCATDFSGVLSLPVNIRFSCSDWRNFPSSDWMNKISLLMAHGGDINALDCIIGTGNGHGIVELEYCTALDLIQSLFLLAERRNLFYGAVEDADSLTAHLTGVSHVLECYDAKVLPREPVAKGVWRIRGLDYYNNLNLSSYAEELMSYEQHF